MATLTIDEYDMANTYAEAFARHCLDTPVSRIQSIYRSHAFPESRLVWKIETPERDYALKIDTLSPDSGRLSKEFDILSKLHDYFRRTGSDRVVKPVYLAPTDEFMVTEFVDRPTAVDIIYNSKDDKQVAQIYRRAGGWLHRLHGFQDHRDYAFRPRWMMDSVTDLVGNVPPHIRELSQPMVTAFLVEAENLRNRPDLRVFSHGDFHGLNLIIGQGTAIGLDFTEARDKLAVYDIVDFLKADIFRDGQDADIDRSGILKKNKEMFFRQYRHQIDMDILDCCLRGRMLKDWLRLWQTDFSCSGYEERKRDRLEHRLSRAFR